MSEDGCNEATSRDSLIIQAIAAVADEGLERMSLRRVASAAGVSTASIFHFFGKKSNLLRASAERALIAEIEFHDRLIEELVGLELDSAALSDLIVSYVSTRRTRHAARFWLELTFNGNEQFPGAELIGRWRDVRRNFWERAAGDATLAKLLINYILMEEVYAAALHDDFAFWPLAEETARVFSSRLGTTQTHPKMVNTVGKWLLAKPQQFTVHEPMPDNAVANRLLQAASSRIISAGIGAVSDRGIARLAKTASSMIAYNFTDSATFLRKAIWRAMLHEIPRSLDPALQSQARRDDLEDWVSVMARMVQPGSIEEQSGFYLGYTRITGQAALLSSRQKELVPLIRHLRIIEGTGTYRACRLYWPRVTEFGAAEAMAFGIWIKGAAMTNNIVKAEGEHIKSTLELAARFFRTQR